MNIQQTALRLEDVNSATRRAKQRIEWLQKELEKLTMDPERDARRLAGECVYCYYEGRIGGAAITESNCRVCNIEMQFGSTAVDALCQPCARRLNLCKACGGDRELHLRRKLDVKGITPKVPFPPPPSPFCGAETGLGPCKLGRQHLGPHDAEGVVRPVLLPLRQH